MEVNLSKAQIDALNRLQNGWRPYGHKWLDGSGEDMKLQIHPVIYRWLKNEEYIIWHVDGFIATPKVNETLAAIQSS